MYRIILIGFVVGFLMGTSHGQVVVEPPLNCTADKVGLTFWFDESPLYYYTCINAYTSMAFPCPEGSGYINNQTVVGCVPWVLWDCTNKDGKPECNAAQQNLRFPALNPYQTWLCQGINNSVLYPCPEGEAWVPDGTTGCKKWSEWSTYCPY